MGNYFYSNHEEFIYATDGGQLFGSGTVSAPLYNVSLNSNSFDGASVSGTAGSSVGAFGCIAPTGPGAPTGTVYGTFGIEVHYLDRAAFYNNSIAYHNETGFFRDSSSTSALFSTYDPFCVGCYVNNVGGNGFHGIWVYGNTSGAVNFDGIEATYNGTSGVGGAGIGLDSSGSGPYTAGFYDNACLVGNASGRVSAEPYVTVTGLPSIDTCPTH